MDNHWLYFIMYSINSISSIIKGDVTVKSHLLCIIQLLNLLSLESDVDVMIYSILFSKERAFLFSSLLQELFSTSYLNVLILLAISSLRERVRVRTKYSSCALMLMVLLFITSLILSAEENSNDSFPSISFSSTEIFCDSFSFVIIAAIFSDISIQVESHLQYILLDISLYLKLNYIRGKYY